MKRSLAWMGLAQGSSLVLQFAASVVLARYLTPYETGIFAVASATAGALSIIQSFGLRSLIVREPILEPFVRTTTFTLNLVISLCLAAGIASIGYVSGAVLRDPGIREVLLVLAIGPLIEIVGFLPSASLERDGQFKILSIVSTSSVLVTTCCIIVLAVLGFSFMSIAYAQCARAVVSTLLMTILGWRYVSFRLSLKAWRRVAGFGIQMLAVSGINALSVRLSELALARLLGVAALGIYTRANGVNALILNNIHLVIARVLFVDFAALHRQGVSLRQRYLETVDIMTVLLWPVFAGCAILSGPFLLAVYGARWLPAAPALSVLAIGSIIAVSVTMTWELFAATGNLRTQTRIEFIRSGVALTAFLVGCTISVTAAAAAAIVDASFAVFLYRRHVNRMTDTTTADFAPIYRRSASLTVLAVTPAGLLMMAYRFSAATPLPLVIASVGLGASLWAFGLVVVKHPLMIEARALFDRLLQFYGTRRTARPLSGK